MPQKKTFLLSSAITPELLEAYPQLGRIQDSPSHGQNLEKLQGIKHYAPYSIRLNKKVRAICTPIKLDGQQFWVLLNIMEDHRYERMSFDTIPGLLMQDLDYLKSQVDTLSKESRLDEIKEEPHSIQELHYYKEHFILFNDLQKEPTVEKLPLLISGAPGSGKTCVAMHLLEQLEGALSYFVTNSEGLIDELKNLYRTQPDYHEDSSTVSFRTYQELVAHFYPNWRHVGLDAYLDWAKQHSISNPKDLYQEFRIFSGYLERPEEYHALGRKQSLFADKSDMQRLYISYLRFLDENHCLDLALQPIRITGKVPKIDFLVIDEAQDFSGLQLNILKSFIDYRHVAIFMDSNQSLNDSLSKTHFIQQIFHIPKESHVHFSDSYRSSHAVIQFANQLLAVKNTVTGGVTEKGQSAQIIPHPHAGQGELFWADLNTENITTLRNRFEDDAGCVVITHPNFHEEVRQHLRIAVILTPEQAKGLEFNHVVTYRIFEHAGHHEVNQKLKSIDELRISSNRSKLESHIDSTHLNEDLVAITRAKEGIFVIEKSAKEHQHRFLLLHLRKDILGVNQDIVQKKHQSTEEEWHAVAKQLETAELHAIAKTIIEQKTQIKPELPKEKSKKNNPSKAVPLAPAVITKTKVDSFIEVLQKKFSRAQGDDTDVSVFNSCIQTQASLFENIAIHDLQKFFEIENNKIVYTRNLMYYLFFTTPRPRLLKYLKNQKTILRALSINDLLTQYSQKNNQENNYKLSTLAMLLSSNNNDGYDIVDLIFKERIDLIQQIQKHHLMQKEGERNSKKFASLISFFMLSNRTNIMLKKVLLHHPDYLDKEMLAQIIIYNIHKEGQGLAQVSTFLSLCRFPEGIRIIQTLFNNHPSYIHELNYNNLRMPGETNTDLFGEISIFTELTKSSLGLDLLCKIYDNNEDVKAKINHHDLFTKMMDYQSIGKRTSVFNQCAMLPNFSLMHRILDRYPLEDDNEAKFWVDKLNFHPERETGLSLYDTSSINLLCTTTEGREFFLRLCQFSKFIALLKPMTFIEPLKTKSFPQLNNLNLYNYLRKNNAREILDTLQRHNPVLRDVFVSCQELENTVEGLSVTLRK